MRPMANDAASESAKIAAFVPMPVPITARVSGCTAAMKMMNGIGRKKLMSTLSTLYTTDVRQQAARTRGVEPRAEQEPAGTAEHHRERDHVERLAGGLPELGGEVEERVHQRASVTVVCAPIAARPASTAASAPSDREGEVAERAAADVVDAAVDELELEARLGELEEHARLRGVAVAERERDDAPLVPLAQHRELGRRRDALHDRAHELLRRRMPRVGEDVEHGAVLDHASPVHDGDPGRDRLDDVHLVRDDDHRDALLLVDPLEEREHLLRGLGVEGARRLVGEQDAPGASRAPGRCRRAASGRPRAGRGSARALSARPTNSSSSATRAVMSAFDQPATFERVRDVRAHGLGVEQVELLEDHADAETDAAELALGEPGDLAPVDADRAARGGLERVDEPHEGGLARTRVADDAVDVARLDVERDVVDGDERAGLPRRSTGTTW